MSKDSYANYYQENKEWPQKIYIKDIKGMSNMSLYGIKSSWWKREIDVVQIKVL